jgi:hypothetical protein
MGSSFSIISEERLIGTVVSVCPVSLTCVGSLHGRRSFLCNNGKRGHC